MASKHLPEFTQYKTLMFYDQTFRRSFFSLNEVQTPLSNRLKSEINLERFWLLSKNSCFFLQIPQELLGALADCIQEITFSTNDVITIGDRFHSQVCRILFSHTSDSFGSISTSDHRNPGLKNHKKVSTKEVICSNCLDEVCKEKNNFVGFFFCNFPNCVECCILPESVNSIVFFQKIFLILSGTIAVYTENGEEIAHLHDGNIFNEISFLLPEQDQVKLNKIAWHKSSVRKAFGDCSANMLNPSYI